MLMDLVDRFPSVDAYLQHVVRLKTKDRSQLIRTVHSILEDYMASDFDGYYTDHEESAGL